MANPSLRIQLETPIIGIEIKPVISNVPEDSLRFTWYRQLYDKNVYCCVHKKKRADIYCSTCRTLMLPLNTSYFCSPVCYHNNWENHHKLHSEWIQYKGVPTTISTRSRLNLGPDYDYYLDDEDINPDDMLEEENGTSWLPVGYSKNYLPSKEDFGSVLKLVAIFVNPSMSSPIPFLYTKHVIESPTPHPRRVIPIGPPPTFRVLTYNLLADCLVNKSHNYCLDWAQTWDYRRQNLLREITSYNADILCLQEVQSNHYDNFLRPELDKLGYSSAFKSKSDGVFTGQGDARHGCATFYRRTRFTEVKHYKLAFRDYGKEFLGWQKRPEQYRRLLQDNVAVVSILQFVGETVVSGDPVYSLCVANTHISSDPKYTDVKLWQVAVLLSAIENIAYPDLPVLFCGDLNSRPGSAPYELVKRGCIPDHLWPDDPTFIAAHTYQRGMLVHGYKFHELKLVSAYSTQNGEPQFTYYTHSSQGTLDYIFYSEEKLRLRGLLDLLGRNDILKNTALPSPEYSSDHIALMAEFSLMPATQHNPYMIPSISWSSD